MDKQLLANGYESDPMGMFHTTEEPGKATPPSYIYQPADWFKPGRFFSIWAPLDVEIHGRQFILLDSKNTEGKGVRVRSLDRDGLNQLEKSSSAYRTTMALKDNKSADSHNYASGHSSSSQSLSHPRGGQQSKKDDDDLIKLLDKKFMPVYMDEHANQNVPRGTFILLEHTYNIPFVKYKCIDHGMLDDESLDTLRFHYVQYLISSWRLTSKARELYGRR